MTQESLTEKLARHLMRPVDDATQARARLHLLDWLGCVAGARQSPVASVAIAAESDAVMRAAMLGNMLEMDDVHRSSILHPGPAIWPAALCAVRDAGGDMAQLLNAAVVGYEATVAIGSTFDARHYAFYHNTSTAGGFGAAAAAACVFGFSAQQYVHALGNAGSVAGGLWQLRHENVMTKQVHAAHCARNGFWQAQMVQHGLSGPAYILEGPQGLYAATCDAAKPMQFPDDWRMHEVSFKPWGACRHAHPAIDAALELKGRLGSLDGEILVESYGDALTFCDREQPVSVTEAKFSLQHALAIVAAKGEPTLADFESDAIARLAEARRAVRVREDAEITCRYPQHYGARVSCNGESVELTDTLGDPERAMDTGQIIGKARALISWGGLPDKEADLAVDLALHGGDVLALHDMLARWLS